MNTNHEQCKFYKFHLEVNKLGVGEGVYMFGSCFYVVICVLYSLTITSMGTRELGGWMNGWLVIPVAGWLVGGFGGFWVGFVWVWVDGRLVPLVHKALLPLH